MECVQIRYHNIQGQHCMTTVVAATVNGSDNNMLYWSNAASLIRENNLTPAIGICLPATCSPDKIISYSNKILNAADLEAVSTVCRTNDPIPFNSIDYLALWVSCVRSVNVTWFFNSAYPSNRIIFGLLLIALTASTIYEVVLLNAGSKSFFVWYWLDDIVNTKSSLQRTRTNY